MCYQAVTVLSDDRWANSKRYSTTQPNTSFTLLTTRPSYTEMIWRYCNFRICEQNPMVVLSFYKMKFPALFLRKIHFIKTSYAKTRCFLVLRIEQLSYDLEKKTREQNRNNKRTEIERFDWWLLVS